MRPAQYSRTKCYFDTQARPRQAISPRSTASWATRPLPSLLGSADRRPAQDGDAGRVMRRVSAALPGERPICDDRLTSIRDGRPPTRSVLTFPRSPCCGLAFSRQRMSTICSFWSVSFRSKHPDQHACSSQSGAARTKPGAVFRNWPRLRGSARRGRSRRRRAFVRLSCSEQDNPWRRCRPRHRSRPIVRRGRRN